MAERARAALLPNKDDGRRRGTKTTKADAGCCGSGGTRFERRARVITHTHTRKLASPSRGVHSSKTPVCPRTSLSAAAAPKVRRTVAVVAPFAAAPSARMAFLAVGALGAAGGFLGTHLLRRGARAGSASTSDRRTDRTAAPPQPKAPARSGEERDARAVADAAGTLAALPPWQPPAAPVLGSSSDGLAWDGCAPPTSLWEAQAQMQRWSMAQALAAERQQVAFLAELRRASWAQDGERGPPAPAMHLSVNVSSSAETAAPPPAPPDAPGAAHAATKVTADVRRSWRDALLRVALRALATVALWEAGKAAARRRLRRQGQTGLQLLNRAMRRATLHAPRSSLPRGDGGGTHKWGFIVL